MASPLVLTEALHTAGFMTKKLLGYPAASMFARNAALQNNVFAAADGFGFWLASSASRAEFVQFVPICRDAAFRLGSPAGR